MTYRKPPFLLRKWQQLQMRYYAYRNPEKLVRIRYRQRFGTDPDLENPQTFNEKVLWMMLHADTTRWSQLADKYRVREYVEQCGLGWMLNELYCMGIRRGDRLQRGGESPRHVRAENQ